MHAISASEAGRMLPSLIERMVDDRDAVEIVTDGGNVALLPADEYAAWQEIAYLLRSPASARRLLAPDDRSGPRQEGS